MSKLQLTKELKDILDKDYFDLREVPGRGVCGLSRMIYTIGLFYGLDEFGYEGRYCYPNLMEARSGLAEWNGEGDPPGDWIKHKGDQSEYPNPNLNKQF